MYRWLRNTHLLIGLFSFLFLMMYGVSSVQMAHNSWFNLKPKVTENRLEVQAMEPRAVAQELMRAHGLRGEMGPVKVAKAGFSFRIARPGTVYEVTYPADPHTALVRTNEAGLMGMLNRIHHIGGLWHDYSLINVWGTFVGLISLLLVVLGLTGIYLWFKIHKERVIGSVLLAASLAFGLTLLVMMRA